MSYPGYEYPTHADLTKIQKWRLEDNKSLPDWLAFVKSKWWMPDWGWREKGRTLWISTGGWSGNESIIGSMERNFMWGLCWVSSRRGGHYTFKIPKFKKAAGK